MQVCQHKHIKISKSGKPKFANRFKGTFPTVSSSASAEVAAFFLFSKSLVEELSLRFFDLLAPVSYQFGASSSSPKVCS